MPSGYQQAVGAYLLDPTSPTTFLGNSTSPLVVSAQTGIQSGQINAPMFAHLSDSGALQSGTDNANGDYSVTADTFYIEAPANLVIARMMIHMEDTSGMASADYGNITSGLTNGVKVYHWDSDGSMDGASPTATVLNTLHVDDPIKTNAGWGQMCYDTKYENVGNGNDFFNARWSFFRTQTSGIRLTTGQRFGITLNDNLSGLITHHFKVQGYFESATPTYS